MIKGNPEKVKLRDAFTDNMKEGLQLAKRPFSSLKTAITIHAATRRITTARQQENLSTRQRWISLSEFVVGGAIVIAHNVYHRVPNEVPILFVLGWISIRLRDGGWKMVGLHKPDSWRKTILWGVLVRVLIIVAGQLADFVGAKIWHQAAKGPAVIKEAKATWKTALLGLSLVWTFAAFGEKMGYRGYLMTRAADVGKSRRRPTWRHCLCPVCCSAMGITAKVRQGFCSLPFRG